MPDLDGGRMKPTRHVIDTVQAKGCYNPADYVTVHKDYLTRLQGRQHIRPVTPPKPRTITHAYELELEA